jgi:hypothetical protein
MSQELDVNNFSAFIDSGDAEYHFSANVACEDGQVVMDITFFDATMTELTSSGMITIFYYFKSLTEIICFLYFAI